ncbi:hypothetical protein [Chengkuizengella axinellae]|uniref:DUF4037 domain-containing protein n=1 Tax=Chengkuizengella axinellae TaxID=3064388 RepID=A0ABT9IUA0_9BACL|nr:hypothetical protein [Chengkuizengella sp. 2205SS18-9]MDP5272863.1 hypothetical protein [Chengkuizengella sp. 2205SS18-9]
MILKSQYVDALYESLTKSNLFSGSKSLLAGMTTNSFRFQVDQRISSEGIFVYNWSSEHWLSCDFLGIYNRVGCWYADQPLFPHYRDYMCQLILDSLEKGYYPVIWNGEFVSVVAYDKLSQTFICKWHEDKIYIKKNDFGLKGYPYWFVQFFGKRLEMVSSDIYKESLVQATYKWESHESILPYNEYGCGKRAYDFLANAFINKDYDFEGAAEVLFWLSRIKKEILQYLIELQVDWNELQNIVKLYEQITNILNGATKNYIVNVDKTVLIPEDNASEMAGMMMGIKELEQTAMDEMKMILREVFHYRNDQIGLR